MAQKRISEKIADLKVGDTVVVYNANGYYTAKEITETVITKIGRDYVYVSTNRCNGKFSKKTGCGEYSYHLFPGTEYEFKLWLNTRIFARDVHKRFESKFLELTHEELNIINEILIR